MAESSHLEKEIMTHLKEGPISVSELAKKLGLRRDFLAGYLESMKDRGRVRKVTVGKAHVYQVIEK